MTDNGKFTEPKNKMVNLLPWEPWPSEFEVQKNDNWALIIEILYLKQNLFETDSCSLVSTTSTSHMQGFLKIDLGLIKLSNVYFNVWSKSLFGDYHQMAHIWAKIQVFD